ncbi:MAG TPA: hypothetical protein VGI45_09035 [Terracidiphilus sp.]|jgi:hypothetical protein
MSRGIVSTVIGGLEIAAGAVLVATGVGAPFGAALIIAGAGSVMTGIAQMLEKQPGQGVATTNPVGAYNYIYGTMKVPGVEIFSETNSITGSGGTTSNDKQWHRVFALACHPTDSLLEVRLDGQVLNLVPQSSSDPNTTIWQSASPTQTVCNITSISRSGGIVTMVVSGGFAATFNGQSMLVTGVADNTYNGVQTVWLPNPADLTTWAFQNGGANGSSSGGNARTCLPDYSNKVHVEFQNGNQTATFPTLLAAQIGSTSPITWTATDVCYGHTLAYVQMGYDTSYFPNLPTTISFVVKGKNDILDPRTGTRGYTENPALCIADYMTVPRIRGGFGLAIGSTIDSSNLIAAANTCDETLALAAGGTVPQYSCNTVFDLNTARGITVDRMLSSCAGRLSVQGGVWSIVPGAWVAPSLYLNEKNIVGPIKLDTRLSVAEACNAAKGTYVSAANNYQPSDYPMYQQDSLHGYGTNTWLVEDNNEFIPHNLDLPCTNVSAVAQRLAKIQLMRQRYQMRLNLLCDMTAYQATVTDVIAISIARYTWVNKPFEVLGCELIYDDNGKPQVALSLAEVDTATSSGDSAIYSWTPTEELAITDSLVPNNTGIRVCVPPHDVVAYSGPGTVISGITYPSTITTGTDGRVQNSIYVRWDTPNDANVEKGGHIEVQYQIDGASTWTGLTKVDPSVSSLFIPNVNDGGNYNVQVRAVNTAGVPSDWISASVTVSSSIGSGFWGAPIAHPVPPPPGGFSFAVLTAQASGGTAQITVGDFNATVGSTTLACTASPNILSGLNQGQSYYVYYIDPSFVGGTITPIATQNAADFTGIAGYFLIGSITTPVISTRYQPSAFTETGASTTSNPTNAYDNNVMTSAGVTSSWWTTVTGTDPVTHLPIYGTGSANGSGTFSGFGTGTTSSSLTLTVVAASSFSGSGASPSCGVSVIIGGTTFSVVGLSGTTGTASYTYTIPSGTDLATLQVIVNAAISAGTPPGGGAMVLAIYEIYIS